MKTQNAPSPAFKMAFSLNRFSVCPFQKEDYKKVEKLIKHNYFSLERASLGVRSIAHINVDKRGHVKSIDIVVGTLDSHFKMKTFFIELFDLLKGKNSKFSKRIKAKDISKESLKSAVKDTSEAYRKKLKILG